MKSLVSRARWALAQLLARAIVTFHGIGKPAGMEVFDTISGTTFAPWPLLSHDDDPDWKVVRYPYNGGPALNTIKPGYLIKVGATRVDVAGAVGTDDAVLEGIVLDVPDPNNPSDTSVGVAFSGSFDKNTVKYADGTQPITAAGLARLRDMGIFLDNAVTGGTFAP
jgi:hypothetical protein